MRERRIPALALPVIEVVAALTVLSVGMLAAGPAATALAPGPGAGAAAAIPTPSDSGTPSPAPTGGGTPTPTPSAPTPTPTASSQATPTPLLTPTVLPTPPTTPSPIEMSSSALQVSGFTYIGVKTLAMPSGPIPVMEFSMADATFTDLVVKTSCTGHTQLSMSQTGAHATGNLTLDLTWFTASVGGTTVAYSASAPPTSLPLSSGAGTFNNVSMIALSGSASQLTLQSSIVTPAGC